MLTINIAFTAESCCASGSHDFICAIWDELEKRTDGNFIIRGFQHGYEGLMNNRYIIFTKDIINTIRRTAGCDILSYSTYSNYSEIYWDKIISNISESSSHPILILLCGVVDFNFIAKSCLHLKIKLYLVPQSKSLNFTGNNLTEDGDDFPITLGYDSARVALSECVGNIAIDSMSSKKYWHFIRLGELNISLEVFLQTRPCLLVSSLSFTSVSQIIHRLCELVSSQRSGIVVFTSHLINELDEVIFMLNNIRELYDLHSSYLSTLRDSRITTGILRREMEPESFSFFQTFFTTGEQRYIRQFLALPNDFGVEEFFRRNLLRVLPSWNQDSSFRNLSIDSMSDILPRLSSMNCNENSNIDNRIAANNLNIVCRCLDLTDMSKCAVPSGIDLAIAKCIGQGIIMDIFENSETFNLTITSISTMVSIFPRSISYECNFFKIRDTSNQIIHLENTYYISLKDFEKKLPFMKRANTSISPMMNLYKYFLKKAKEYRLNRFSCSPGPMQMDGRLDLPFLLIKDSNAISILEGILTLGNFKVAMATDIEEITMNNTGSSESLRANDQIDLHGRNRHKDQCLLSTFEHLRALFEIKYPEWLVCSDRHQTCLSHLSTIPMSEIISTIFHKLPEKNNMSIHTVELSIQNPVSHPGRHHSLCQMSEYEFSKNIENLHRKYSTYEERWTHHDGNKLSFLKCRSYTDIAVIDEDSDDSDIIVSKSDLEIKRSIRHSMSLQNEDHPVSPSKCVDPSVDIIGIVFLDSPAPGVHNIVIGLHKYLEDRLCQKNVKFRLIGFIGGLSGIVYNNYIDLTDGDLLTWYQNSGGQELLCHYGASVGIESESPEFGLKIGETISIYHGLSGLVCVGGRQALIDTIKISLTSQVNLILVPSSIDHEFPNDVLTVGFDTAVSTAASILSSIGACSKSDNSTWYFVRMVGSNVSHFAVEVALRTTPQLVLISEEIFERRLSLSDVVHLIANCVCERGRNYQKFHGVVLIPDGVVNAIPDLKNLICEILQICDRFKTEHHNSSLEQKRIIVSSLLSTMARPLFVLLPNHLQSELVFICLKSDVSIDTRHVAVECILITLVQTELKRRNEDDILNKIKFKSHLIFHQVRGAAPSSFDSIFACHHGYFAGILLNDSWSGLMTRISSDLKKFEGLPLLSFLKAGPSRGPTRRIFAPPSRLLLSRQNVKNMASSALLFQDLKLPALREVQVVYPLQYSVIEQESRKLSPGHRYITGEILEEKIHLNSIHSGSLDIEGTAKELINMIESSKNIGPEDFKIFNSIVDSAKLLVPCNSNGFDSFGSQDPFFDLFWVSHSC